MDSKLRKVKRSEKKHKAEEKKRVAYIEKKKLEEWWQKIETLEGAQELKATADAKIGSCPIFKGKHEYQRRLPCGDLSQPSDWLQECKDFQALNPQQRAGVIQDKGGCVVCLSWGHHKFRCNMVQRHNEGGPGTGCEERDGAGVLGNAHGEPPDKRDLGSYL